MQIANQTNANSPFHALPAASGINANDATTSTAPSSSSSTSTATITANDFLQLLVTELQNQDPTANTDPNQYVDQLVQVNSLQQQIQMNQTLDGGPTLTGASSGVLQELTQMNQTLDGAAAAASSGSNPAITSAVASHANTHAAAVGNLSSPSSAEGQSAAESIATALAPTPHATTAQTQAFEQFAALLKAKAPTK
jgi:flagellar basal-body rod modification protein FlgD